MSALYLGIGMTVFLILIGIMVEVIRKKYYEDKEAEDICLCIDTRTTISMHLQDIVPWHSIANQSEQKTEQIRLKRNLNFLKINNFLEKHNFKRFINKESTYILELFVYMLYIYFQYHESLLTKIFIHHMVIYLQ